jgi:hypothetical protein
VDDNDGNIGKVARTTLKRLASSVYWQGLSVWGIRSFRRAQVQYHRAVARDSYFGDRLPLKQYLAASHIVIVTCAGVQTIPDKQLAAAGAKRSSCIRVPYFGVALQCLPGTELILTLTRGMTSVLKNDPGCGL